MPKLKVEWCRDDLIFDQRQFAPARLKEELERRPFTAVLFSNVIGQLPLLRPDLNACFRAWWKEVQPSSRAARG